MFGGITIGSGNCRGGNFQPGDDGKEVSVLGDILRSIINPDRNKGDF